ncbi:ribosomal RNA processing protein 36 homolog [Nymphalis io]|uniref:ribosomal RNA processing protein 36 homolog n=1 Tax=Inachis io TaxID=171585 RepID=UPI00216AB05A|nr:ribosomal RNA processing protein 36 homolog [Nymphalis io]XP_050354232.1 ribosomal RNA processing protein 36 homolog [Nymphalis io]
MKDSVECINNSDEEQDDERIAIKKELSSLSFEALQKLKEKVGSKVYKQAIFGENKKVPNAPKVFKRENKNRPREMSSKRPVPMLQEVVTIKKKEIRDPRFDPLCGTFDKKEFSENYGFLSNIRINDIKAIRAELKKTTDPEKEQSLRRLLQRLNDQHKDSKKKKKERDVLQKQKDEVDSDFRTGKHPHFKNKSELRVETLVKQYEELKKKGTGRIQRHLKRRQQKIKKRSFRTPMGES